jgi:hypothetical protein
MMRAACAGLLVGAAILTASSAALGAPISPSAIRQAADEVAVVETVHCRRYRHLHRWGYGRGCRGAASYAPRVRYRASIYGPRVRSSYSIRYREYYYTGNRYARPSAARYQYGQANLGYRGARPQSKWDAKGFCPPGQAKKGNC